MKKITIHKVRTLLESCNADESTIELILNNISMYNSIVTEISKGESVNKYLAYQLNIAITKQIEAVKKSNAKSADADEQDFNIFKNKFKKIETR